MDDAELAADDFLSDRVIGYLDGALIAEIPAGDVQHFTGETGNRNIDIDVQLVNGVYIVAGCTFGVQVGP